jgi:hypothetical protein
MRGRHLQKPKAGETLAGWRKIEPKGMKRAYAQERREVELSLHGVVFAIFGQAPFAFTNYYVSVTYKTNHACSTGSSRRSIRGARARWFPPLVCCGFQG